MIYMSELRENGFQRIHTSENISGSHPKLPCGIVYAGRQLILAVEERLRKEAGLSRAIAAWQLHVRTDTDGTIVSLICRLSDDFLIAGERQYSENFLHHLKIRFDVGKISAGRNHSFGGCDITVDNEGITITMD